MLPVTQREKNHQTRNASASNPPWGTGRREALRGLRSGTLPPVPLPDGPTLFVISAAVGPGLAWGGGEGCAVKLGGAFVVQLRGGSFRRLRDALAQAELLGRKRSPIAAAQ